MRSSCATSAIIVRRSCSVRLEAAVPGGYTAATFVGPAASELRERQQQFHKEVAAKLGVAPERLEQALNDAAREVGVPAAGIAGPVIAFHAVAFGPDLDTAAKGLDMGVEPLRAELKTKSLTTVARARTVDPGAVATALKGAERKRLDEAAARGDLPAELAARLKGDLDERIERLMTLPFPAGGDVISLTR